MKRTLLSFVLLSAFGPSAFAQISTNTMFIAGTDRPLGVPAGGTLGLEFNQAAGYMFAFNYSSGHYLPVSTAYSRLLVAGNTDPQSLLSVAGTVTAQKVKVTATGWSDFVFADHYRLPSLYELEKFVKQHKHLPDIPAEAAVLENGVDVAEMDKKLLQKIEELTLYVIALQKQLDAQRCEIRALKETSVH